MERTLRGIAGVYGLDVNVDAENESLGVKYGSKLSYYHVAASKEGGAFFCVNNKKFALKAAG